MAVDPAVAHYAAADDFPTTRYAWCDADGKPLDEEGESAWSPIAGVAVRLTDADGAEVATTMTADDGSYHFDGLPVGDYTVVFTAPRGATAAPSAGDRGPGLLPTPVQTWTAGTPFHRAGPGRLLRVVGTLG